MKLKLKIAELAEAVEQILEAGRLVQPSGRVRDVPDARTIRYYTTLGLLDRPLEMQGRTAYYGWRHVWQLLAIKRLQRSGAPLVEIQQRLAGADDRTLKKLAEAPEPLVRATCLARLENQPSAEPPPPARNAFWAAPTAAPTTTDAIERIDETSFVVRRALHIQLGEGMTLVLEGIEPEALDRDKLAALESAARSLIDPSRPLARQKCLPQPSHAERSRS